MKSQNIESCALLKTHPVFKQTRSHREKPTMMSARAAGGAGGCGTGATGAAHGPAGPRREDRVGRAEAKSQSEETGVWRMCFEFFCGPYFQVVYALQFHHPRAVAGRVVFKTSFDPVGASVLL